MITDRHGCQVDRSKGGNPGHETSSNRTGWRATRDKTVEANEGAHSFCVKERVCGVLLRSREVSRSAENPGRLVKAIGGGRKSPDEGAEKGATITEKEGSCQTRSSVGSVSSWDRSQHTGP